MTLDRLGQHPMWADLRSLDAGTGFAATGDELVCRIALTSVEMHELTGELVVSEHLRRLSTWDAPHLLLADDDELADRLRDAGLALPRPASAYADRQADAFEAFAAALHRYQDHGETPHDIERFEPGVGVVVATGRPHVRALLARLLSAVARGGVVLDVRTPREVRAFALQGLARERLIVVLPDRCDEHRRDGDVEALLDALCP